MKFSERMAGVGRELIGDEKELCILEHLMWLEERVIGEDERDTSGSPIQRFVDCALTYSSKHKGLVVRMKGTLQRSQR